MTLETINRNGGVGMTTAAKMFATGNVGIIALFVWSHMTINARDQAMFGRPYTFMHRFITMMLQKMSMITADQFNGFNTFLGFRNILFRFGRVRNGNIPTRRGWFSSTYR